MNRFIIILSFVLFASSPALCLTMEEVMSSCKRFEDFDSFYNCIKNTYKTQGNTPNSGSVLSFYSQMDSILMRYENRQISNNSAISNAYSAWDKSINSANNENERQATERRKARALEGINNNIQSGRNCFVKNGVLYCY